MSETESLYATAPADREPATDPGPAAEDINRCMGCAGVAQWTGETYDDCLECQQAAYEDGRYD